MNIARKSFSIFQRDILLFIVNTLVGVIIARKLGPEYMGIWAILLLIPGYAEAFARFKFDASSIYFLGKKESSVEEMIFLLHFVALIGSSAFIIIFMFCVNFFEKLLFSNVDIDVRTYIHMTMLIIPLRMIFLNYMYLHIFLEKVFIYNKMVVIQVVSTACISLICLCLFDIGISGALLGSILGLFFGTIYGAWELNKVNRIKWFFSATLLKKMAAYSIHTYISSIYTYMQTNISDTIMARYLPPASVAFFSLSKSIGDVASRMIPAAVNTITLPKISKAKNDNEASKMAVLSFRIILLLLLAISCAVTVCIKPLILFVYGKEYLPMIEPFRIILPGVICIQLSSVFSTYFTGSGKANLIPKISLFPLIIQTLMSFYLVPSIGVIGAAVSFLASSILMLALCIVYFINCSQLSCYSLIPSRGDVNLIKKFIITHLTSFFNRFKHEGA